MRFEGRYSEEGWQSSLGGRPLGTLDVSEIALLDRHATWASHQRSRFLRTVGGAAHPDSENFLADEPWATLFLWCALLSTIVEALVDRGIPIGPPMNRDLDVIRPVLRDAHEATLELTHPLSNATDEQIFRHLTAPGIPQAVTRVSTAIDRLLKAERAARDTAGPRHRPRPETSSRTGPR